MAEDLGKSSIPSLPLEDILVDVAHSLVQAQQTLDSASLAAEIRIRETGLDELGIASHWYTIPELNFDLRLAFDLSERGELKTQMVDAEYQSKYGFNLQASSLLKTRIVPIPSGETAGLSLLDQRFVLQRIGQLKRVVEAYGRSDAPHFVIHYHPFVRQGYAGGLWHVLLLDAQTAGGSIPRALILLNDADGEVLRVWTDLGLQPVTVLDVIFTPEQAEAALELVNTAPAATLDEAVGLNPQAVTNILAARPIRSLPGLASVKFVGAASLQKIRDFVPVTVDGVSFTSAEAAAVLQFVNTAAEDALKETGLSETALASLLAGRPFDSLAAISRVPYVGPASLEKLLAYVNQRGAQP
jgi:DNA uptake protein ComE-like DNA-binding protein